MNRPAAGRNCELLRVPYRDGSAVSQINIDRQEWRCRLQLAYLLDGHVHVGEVEENRSRIQRTMLPEYGQAVMYSTANRQPGELR